MLPRLNLSVKISALTPDVQPADPESSLAALKRRLRPILRRAASVGAFINFDMESYRLKDLTLELFRSILEEPEFHAAPAAGIALRAYLRDSERDLRDLVGNLYLNRGCTGAMVQRHPFGGFRMSGGGTKAGGPEYLENFLFPRVIAENTLRRGFTPPDA